MYPNKIIKVLITGGSGFIGRNLVEFLLNKKNYKIFNIDKNGYASETNFKLNEINNERYKFYKCDLCNKVRIKEIVFEIIPDLIINLAAETHVDRSIDNPELFITNNIMGTLNLLEAARKLYYKMPNDWQENFIFYHAGTDEVYGSALENEYFNENSKYNPRSPYSTSKASSNFLVQSWFYTYNIPIVIGNCSNNFGPAQFPEKLIPLSIFKALNNQKIPLYGNGESIRDWIYVKDHINAILKIIEFGKPGESYCIGANNLRTNNQIVQSICDNLDKKLNPRISYRNLISYVDDRPGHDKRYALDIKKLKKDLNWEPIFPFKENLKLTVDWYVDNQLWCERQLSSANYNCERLGLNK